MVSDKHIVKCPWCGTSLSSADVKTSSRNLGAGPVRERHCGKCGKVLAAYLESEGSFLPGIRTFQTR